MNPRRAAALLAILAALPACTPLLSPSRMALAGDIAGACATLQRCVIEKDVCEEMDDAARARLQASLVPEAARRAGVTLAVRELGREALAQRTGLGVPSNVTERSVTLEVGVKSRDPKIQVKVHTFRLYGVPDLDSEGDIPTERYVLALGGPRRPAVHPAPGGGGGTGLGAFVTGLLRGDVVGILNSLGGTGGGPIEDYTDDKGRVVDHFSWSLLDEVAKARALHDPSEATVPPGGEATLTRGFTVAPWPIEGHALGEHDPVWAVDLDKWNRAVAVSPAGWIATVGGSSLDVLDGETGVRVARMEACSIAPGGLFVPSAERGILVCDDGMDEISFPEMKGRRVVRFGLRAEVTAHAAGSVAVAARKGRVVPIYSTGTWALRAEVHPAAEVRALAISPDGATLAVHGEDGSLVLHDIDSGKVLSTRAGGGSGSGGIAFSPDGQRVFYHDAGFTAHEVDARTGKDLGVYRTGSWLTTVRYVSPRTVIATGSDGTVLYDVSGPPSAVERPAVKANIGGSTEGLGASSDGRFFCSGDRSGSIVCFAKGEAPKTTLFPAWRPAARELLVDMSLALTAADGASCTLPAAAHLPLTPDAPGRKALAAVLARGTVDLASVLE